MIRTVIAALLLAGLTLPATAQRPDRPQDRHRHREHAGRAGGPGPGMEAMRSIRPFEPGALIDRARVLELTEQQLASLDSIRTSADQAEGDAHAPAHAAMQQVRQELDKDEPNPETVTALIAAHHTAMGNVMAIRAKAALAARALLTPEQRQRAAP